MTTLPSRVFLVGGFFFFQHYECMVPLPLAHKVSAKRSAFSLMRVALYVTGCFSLPDFKILSCLYLLTRQL